MNLFMHSACRLKVCVAHVARGDNRSIFWESRIVFDDAFSLKVPPPPSSLAAVNFKVFFF